MGFSHASLRQSRSELLNLHITSHFDLSHLVAAVGSTSAAVVWTDPGCIDLQTARGVSLASIVVSSRRTMRENESGLLVTCQVERGLGAGQECRAAGGGRA